MTVRVKRDCQCDRVRHEHGTRTAYTYCKCRCWPCTIAYNESRRAWYAGTTEPRRNSFTDRTGTRRRLEALHRIGWSGTELGQRLGITFQSMYLLRTSTQPIHPGIADRIAALYDELWDEPPTGRNVKKTINWATRQGFAPPMAWDDEEIDDPAAVPHLDGPPAPRELRPHGTLAAVRRHHRKGESLCTRCRAAEERGEDEAGAA